LETVANFTGTPESGYFLYWRASVWNGWHQDAEYLL
jgi:hypothetical protein